MENGDCGDFLVFLGRWLFVWQRVVWYGTGFKKTQNAREFPLYNYLVHSFGLLALLASDNFFVVRGIPSFGNNKHVFPE